MRGEALISVDADLRHESRSKKLVGSGVAAVSLGGCVRLVRITHASAVSVLHWPSVLDWWASDGQRKSTVACQRFTLLASSAWGGDDLPE